MQQSCKLVACVMSYRPLLVEGPDSKDQELKLAGWLVGPGGDEWLQSPSTTCRCTLTAQAA